jgi:hypothetical protein
MTPITAAEKAKEARREVAMRRRVYPGWVGGGKLSQAAADRQIAIMQAIADDYERMAEAEAAQGRLL